jgi:transcriptional regulator with XRE-family HTH domain
MPRVSRLKLPPLEIDQKTIGQRLARIRKQKGYTQKTLADKMGLIQALVSAYELGKIRLNAEMVVRFAKALEVSADEILGLKDNGGGKEDPSLRLIRRINRIESLPPARQKTVLKAIDFMLDSAERQD